MRERREDIPALVEHFAAQVCAQNNWKPVTFTSEAVKAFEDQAWPGNIRELRNTVERLMLLASDEPVSLEITRSVLSPMAPSGSVSPGSGTLSERVEQFEREVILAELKQANFHMTNVAKTLGLERSHLYKKAEQLGIDIRKARRDGEEP